MSFRLLYNRILTSTTVIIERISRLINVTDNNMHGGNLKLIEISPT